ncbi:helix-turn-helix domain-containing protein [Chloroflexota bacterium]
METTNNNNGLDKILKQHRLMASLTLRELAAISGISASHLGRIERRERFPSASVLRKIAQPLGFREGELFSLAGYLSPSLAGIGEGKADYIGGQLDPYVSRVLGEESVEVQRATIGIISILKSIAKGAKG